METKLPEKKSKDPKAIAGLTGVSGGTILIALINKFSPPDIKEILMLIAPTVTILTSALYLWGVNKIKEKVDYQELENRSERLKEKIESLVTDESTTDEQKKKLISIKENVDLKLILFDYKRIESIANK